MLAWAARQGSLRGCTRCTTSNPVTPVERRIHEPVHRTDAGPEHWNGTSYDPTIAGFVASHAAARRMGTALKSVANKSSSTKAYLRLAGIGQELPAATPGSQNL
jgi:hypothetical protein